MSAASTEDDPRIQALRCTSCNRLRPTPRDYSTVLCSCGGRVFSPTAVLPDEEQIALKMYQQDIEEKNLWRLLL